MAVVVDVDAVAAPARPTGESSTRSPWSVLGPTLVALCAATAFVVVHPPVGDLWAARARQSAAGHGVGLTYWFSWFGGGSAPGSYSVLAPYLSTLFGAAGLGALATVAITPLCWWLLRGASHPVAATWAATITTGFSLWSGRIPFALGTAVSLAALIAVRSRRPGVAAGWAVLTVLVSPVSGAFLALGLLGTALHSRTHRTISVTTMLTATVSLGAVGLIFGMPGPEGFTALQALLSVVALSLFLLTGPPAYLRTVILISIAICPLLVLIPNGMGSNFQRLIWICLPVAVIATGTRRLLTVLLPTCLAICSGTIGTVQDLGVARDVTSSPAYYAPLARELDTIKDLTNYRLEAVPDGTHAAAFTLLGHAMLARGYETQADNALNAVLMSTKDLNAVTYKIWLNNNAVGYVAIDHAGIYPNPEYNLVAKGHLPYLIPVWTNPDWTLYRVANATPIVAPPARILDADQSHLTIEAPQAATIPVRVRWSRFLTATGPVAAPAAKLTADGQGWTLLTVAEPGRYVLHG
ncbi:MAG TPA: hypothetical protein VFN75_05230 [Pseudonocardiaceae bacterium]|nr:hypothetical protein [Pseudonocardiaceae bacterium]